ncbi:MAG: ABC transporter permease subunit [Clostridia bacterium]|jgi:raffinose/stachyose/melibiose transport system permease protein|nr:ABC transporter permease subunit [Clostridia bacterium]
MYTRGSLPRKIGIYVIVLIMVGLMTYPLIWMIYSSLKTDREIYLFPFSLPDEMQLDNWVQAWKLGNLGRYFINSVFITSVSVFLVALISSMAGYAFARLTFKGRDLLFYTFLLGLILPAQVLIIPLFTFFDKIGILNTYFALILPYIAWGLPLSIYIFKSFFLTLPEDIADAAKIDGCSLFGLYWRIMLPLIRPALVTIAILQSIGIWNEFLLALLFIYDDELKTIPVGLLAFYGYHNVNYKLVFSALSITTIPVIIVYFIFEKQIVSGLTAGALD